MTLLWICLACVIYPIYYDGTQMAKQGSSYFSEGWNYIDILNISLGLGNIYC